MLMVVSLDICPKLSPDNRQDTAKINLFHSSLILNISPLYFPTHKNLLEAGLNVYLIDWGYPTKTYNS